MKKPTSVNLLGAIVRDYFADHLPGIRGSSPHTILSYRDSIVLLLRFVAEQRKVQSWPSTLPTWTRHTSSRSYRIWRLGGVTVWRHAMCGWQPFMHSSVSWHHGIQSSWILRRK